MNMFGLFKKSKDKKQDASNIVVSSTGNELTSRNPGLHEDLKGLVWICFAPVKTRKNAKAIRVAFRT